MTRYVDVPPEEWVGLAEAGGRLGVSPRQVRRLIRHQHLDAALADGRTFGVTRTSLAAEEHWLATAGRRRKAGRLLGDVSGRRR